jgi:hypothetical protein
MNNIFFFRSIAFIQSELDSLSFTEKADKIYKLTITYDNIVKFKITIYVILREFYLFLIFCKNVGIKYNIIYHTYKMKKEKELFNY